MNRYRAPCCTAMRLPFRVEVKGSLEREQPEMYGPGLPGGQQEKGKRRHRIFLTGSVASVDGVTVSKAQRWRKRATPKKIGKMIDSHPG